MNKRLYVLYASCLLFTTTVSKAQSIQNGEFSVTNPAKSEYVAGICTLFDDGYLPNWFRSHGTPEMTVPNTPGSVRLNIGTTDDGHTRAGEGIVGGYPFIAGVPYTIEIGVVGGSGISGAQPLDLYFYGASGLVEGNPVPSWCIEPAPTYCGGFPGSSVFTTGTNPLGQYCQKEFFNSNVFTVVPFTYSFTYTPSYNNDQFWIIAGGRVNIPSFIDLDYVRIKSCVSGSIAYNDYTANAIPSGLTAKTYISTWGSVPTTNNASANTIFLGANISLAPVTQIQVNPENYFLAIAVTDCDGDYGGGGGGTQSKSGVTNNSAISRSNNKNEGLNIYPNPTSSSFTITFPSTDNYLVKITDMVGTTVYSNSFENTQKQQINTDNLPSGTYTIQVAGSNNSFVQKLVITK